MKDILLKRKIDSVSRSFHNQTGGYCSIEEASFTSFPEFTLRNISIEDSLHQPVLTIKKVSARIALKKLVQLRAGLAGISIDTLTATLIRDSVSSNYSFIMKRKTRERQTEEISAKRTLASVVNSLFENLKDIGRFKAEMREFRIKVVLNNVTTNLHIPYGLLNKGIFNMSVKDESFSQVLSWTLKGELSDDNKRVDFILEKEGSSRNAYFPFFNMKDKLNVGCNRIFASVQEINTTSNSSSFIYKASIDTFKINHWRIADDVVVFDSLRCNFSCSVDGNTFTIDSSSFTQLNKIKAGLSFLLEMEQTLKTGLKMRIHTSAADFFSSLPKALFFAFDGMQFRGALNYNLEFSVDTSKLDDLVFNSSLRGKNFGVVRYGNTYFPKINQSFLYDAYDGERFVKSFWIGPENPDFVPLSHVATHLQYAVLTSEDPSFFYHRGFVEESFRESIIENIREKRFVRGGSTISMQLVKNVFLSREKNISRKLQEALIVWLIENNNISSKERMFEIYLNAIEWGPGVYGIKQASWFYFKKAPAELSLAESIYLASIIPRPKYFRYNFDKEGKLKPYLSSYYKLVTNRMLSKTWITPFDTVNLQPQVVLKGEALRMILPDAVIPVDSVGSVNDIFN